MPNPRPDFAQFAEILKLAAEQIDRYGVSPLSAGDVQQAERHARLLETIQTWANQDADEVEHDCPSPVDSHLKTFAAGEVEGARQVKAHIRSLLEPQ